MKNNNCTKKIITTRYGSTVTGVFNNDDVTIITDYYKGEDKRAVRIDNEIFEQLIDEYTKRKN